MYECKITVLKRMANHDLMDAYMGETYRARRDELAPCPHFEEGQEFVVKSFGTSPEGFCVSAWADIRRYLGIVMSGGDLVPWVKDPGTAIACCNDGYRPVVFRITRVEDYAR